jgi:hypothetical protein
VSTVTSTLTIYQHNVRGFNNFNSFNEWKASLCALTVLPKIIVLSEVKLKPTVPIAVYNLRHYTLHACLRDSSNSKGGLLVYIHDSINHHCAENVSSTFEKISFDIILPHHSFSLTAFYRPPLPGNFNDFLTSAESSLERSRHHHILVGDLNIDKHSNSSESRKYKHLLTQFNMIIANNDTTRNVSGKIIDHFCCNFFENLPFDVHTIDQDPTFSDHNIIYVEIFTNSNEPKLKTTVTKQLLDYPLLDGNFTLSLGELSNCLDPDVIATKITEATQTAIALSTRSVTHTLNKDKKLAPWVNARLLELMKTKDKFHAKLRQHPNSSTNLESFKHANEVFKRENVRIRNSFYQNKCTTNDPKKAWKNLNDILGKKKNTDGISSLMHGGNKYTEPIDIANCLNSFFTNLPLPIPLCPTNFKEPQSMNPCSLYLFPTSNAEVAELINSLKTNSAPGIDNITPKVIKRLKFKLVPILVCLMNAIFATGRFPCIFKRAIVTPIFKSGNREDPSNYRPIAILPVYSKIVEKLIQRRITDFLNKHNILIPCQFGFRRKSGTENAAIDVVNYIQSQLNCSKKVTAIFLDLQKAFDSVEHDKLLMILNHLGIRGIANDLIKNYLSYRSQQVRTLGYLSNSAAIKQGVIQGSTIGPLLFLMAINGLGLISTKGRITLYADDAVLLLSHDRDADPTPDVISDMDKIINFLSARALVLNKSKTVFMLFHSPYLNPSCPLSFRISNDLTISKTQTFKYLGLTLDPSLTFSAHIQILETKISRAAGALWRLKSDLPLRYREMIYNSLVLSYLNYIVTCWGSATNNAINQLQVLQNRALRNVYGHPHLYNRTKMYSEHKKLPIRGLCMLRTAVFVFQSIHDLNHSTIKLRKQESQRNGPLLAYQRPINSFGVKSIACFGPRTFNILPLHTRSCQSLPAFKQKTTEFLLEDDFIPKLFAKHFLNINLLY